MPSTLPLQRTVPGASVDRWPDPRATKLILLGILALAFVLRLVYVLQSQANPYFAAPAMDPLYHVDWAKAFAAGETFDPGRPFFRAPLYPWFLGLTFQFFGENYVLPRLLQAGFGTVTTGLCYLLGRTAFDRRTGLLAAFFAATFWVLIYFDGELLIPTLAVPLNLLGLWLALRLARLPTKTAALLAGLAFGAAAIARPNVLAFMPVLAAWLWFRSRRRQSHSHESGGLTLVLCLTIGTILPILPITAYNAAQGDPVLVASQAGVNLWIGNNPQSDGSTAIVPGTRPGWWEGYHDAIAQAEAAAGRKLRASEVSAHYSNKAIRFFAEQPAAAVAHLGWKLRLFWSDWELGNNQPIYFFAHRFGPIVRLLPLGFWWYAPLGLLGLWFCLRGGASRNFPLWSFVIVYSCTVVAFFVCSRFRLPVLPVLMVFTAHALFQLWKMLQSRAWRSLAGSFAAWSVLLVAVVNVPAAVDRSDGSAMRQIGNFAFSQQNYREAARLYQKALAYPDLPRRMVALLHKDLGASLARLGEHAAAKSALETAIKLQPDQAEALIELTGLLRDRMKQPDAALRVAVALTKRQPTFGQGHYELGKCYIELGKPNAAAQAFLAGLRLRGAAFECALVLSQLFYNNRDWQNAERYTRLALQKSTKSDAWYFAAAERLVLILRATNRRGEAIEFARRLPPHPQTDRLRKLAAGG